MDHNESNSDIPKIGGTIRTKKNKTEGIVERIGQDNEVFFRIADGRLMKTPMHNVIPVEKLEDGDTEIMESELNEISNELLAKYKTAASTDASKADKESNFEKGNKRFSGIVSATKKQFANDKKKEFVNDRDMGEGSMGGINRCAPSTDVSYEHVLDEVMEKWSQELNEISVDKLKNYVQKAQSVDPVKDRFKAARHIEGHRKAQDKIATKTADRTGPELAYQDRLKQFLDVDEAFNKDEFSDILNKQQADTNAAKPKAKIVDINFHGWTIRYRPVSEPGQKVQWMILDKKNIEKKRGESMSDKEAVHDAEEWIKSGGGVKQEFSGVVTLDFNAAFAKEFAPEGETIYATVSSDNGTPMLYVSTKSENGLKPSIVRTQKSKEGAGTTKLPKITLSSKEANAAGLVPHGRYILGSKNVIDDNTEIFPLIYQSTVQGKGDIVRTGNPGLTVAVDRVV